MATLPKWLAGSLVFLSGLACCPAGSSPELITVQSSSKQFLVYGAPPSSDSALRRLEEGNVNALTLEPSFLAISCERIKQALLRQLDTPDNWRSHVHVVQRRTWSSTAACSLSANRFQDGWSYRLEIPEIIEPGRLIEMITRVLLIEMANRHAPGQSAELPLWLAEGFPPFLQLTSDTDLVVKPPQSATDALAFSRVVQNKLMNEELNQERARFAQSAALSVQQLSWPEEQLLSGTGLQSYRESAKWFVYELLRMEEGERLFRTFLSYLPRYHNWQTAFFAAYAPNIRTPLELEKWWALRLTAIDPRVAPLPVAMDNSLALLDQVLRTPMQVRIEAEDHPLRSVATLQEALKVSDDRLRFELARETLLRLHLVRGRLAAPHLEIAEAYRDALARYLVARNDAASAEKGERQISIKRSDGPASARRTADPLEELIQTLSELDSRRETLAMPSMALSPGDANAGGL